MINKLKSSKIINLKSTKVQSLFFFDFFGGTVELFIINLKEPVKGARQHMSSSVKGVSKNLTSLKRDDKIWIVAENFSVLTTK